MPGADTVSRLPVEVYLLKHAPTKILTGDFDGNGTIDTLTQFLYSTNYKQKIDSLPDELFYNKRDLVNFGYNYKLKVFLKPSIVKADILNAGEGLDLFCLINLGKLIDKKDAVALVTNYYDHTILNSCKVFILQDKHWKYLTRFGINEMAFTANDDITTNFKNIPGYLEKDKSGWKFHDGWQDPDEKPLKNLKSYILKHLHRKEAN